MKHCWRVMWRRGNPVQQSCARRISATFIIVGCVAVMLLLKSPGAVALPGTHGRSVSTWDTTRSTVVFSYQHGFLLSGGYTNVAGYNANFTSTTGKLSAQFGLQYVNYKPKELEIGTHGISGSAVTVYGIPIGNRHPNGLPKAAFTLFFGSVPTAVVNGEYNYITVPIVLGFGIEMSPIRHISIVPWFEIAPSFNMDTIIDPYIPEDYEQFLEGIEIDENGNVVDIQLDENAVFDVLQQSVNMDFSFGFRMRGGLSLVANLGDRVDLQINGTVSQAARDFNGSPNISVGGAFVFAWDDPPAAVLPAETRLAKESCPAISKRYESCAEYSQLVKTIREEERQKLIKAGTLPPAPIDMGPTSTSEKEKPTVEPQKSPIEKPLSPEPVGVPGATVPPKSQDVPEKPKAPEKPKVESSSAPLTTPSKPVKETTKPDTPSSSDKPKTDKPKKDKPAAKPALPVVQPL